MRKVSFKLLAVAILDLLPGFNGWSLGTPVPSWEPASDALLDQGIHPDFATKIQPQPP